MLHTYNTYNTNSIVVYVENIIAINEALIYI